MQELAKILKKIERYIKIYQMPPLGREAEGTVELLEECRNIIRKQINAGWIPVEERLPEAGKSVLCCSDDERMIIGVLHKEYYIDFGIAVAENYNQIMHDVIAWRPLPEPYRPERSEE